MMKVFWRKVSDPFRRSIRSKLMLALILVAAVPITAVTGLAAENTRKSMEAEVMSSNLSSIKWTSVYLGEQFQQLNNLIYSLMINQALSDYLSNAENGDLARHYAAQRNLTEMLTSAFYSANPNVLGVELYLKEPGKLFTVDSGGSVIHSPGNIPSPYRELFSRHDYFTILVSKEEPDRFKFVRSINRFEDHETIGGIALTVRWSQLDQTLALLNAGNKNSVLLTNSAGGILYQPDGNPPTKEELQFISQASDGPGVARVGESYVFYSLIDPSGLKLVKLIPANSVYHSAWRTMKYGLIVGALSVTASILVAILVAWGFTRPIVALARSMQGLGPIRVPNTAPSRRIDEFGLLQYKFDNMSHRIREHIKNEYSMTLEKQTAELKALQAQINPHFLQNTLQLIGSMLFRSSPADSYAIIRSLSSMFRYVIREPEEMATIREETDHLGHYMDIQNWRYGSRLTYTIRVDEETLNDCLPRLTLQPIVENAFFHGLERKSGPWILDVVVCRQGDNTVIEVRDNGAGMTEARLAEIRGRLQAKPERLWASGTHIGLTNVASRIRLHFGEPYGMDIRSMADEGTTVYAVIPAIVQKEVDP